MRSFGVFTVVTRWRRIPPAWLDWLIALAAGISPTPGPIILARRCGAFKFGWTGRKFRQFPGPVRVFPNHIQAEDLLDYWARKGRIPLGFREAELAFWAPWPDASNPQPKLEELREILKWLNSHDFLRASDNQLVQVGYESEAELRAYAARLNGPDF